MNYLVESFERAKEKGYEPPWGYPDWESVEQECYDFDILAGLWSVTIDGESFFISDDGGEPEDQTLTRNWAWVAGALNDAYAQGVIDGQDTGLRVAT